MKRGWGVVVQAFAAVRVLLASIVVASTLMLCPATEAGAAAPPVPDGPRIAFVRWDLITELVDLASVTSAGSRPLRLLEGRPGRTPVPSILSAPSWSPDGTRLAFEGAPSIFAPFRSNRVYLLGGSGKGAARAVPGTGGALQPRFTPDGSAVAFTRTRRRGASIWLTDLAGGTAARITAARRNHYMLPAGFSPDGRTLFAGRFVEGRGEGAVAVHLDTGEIETILLHANEPAFSPDGTRLAFLRWKPVRRRDGSRTIASDIYVASSDGTGIRRLTKTPVQDELAPSWSPSGERLAFVRNLPEGAEQNELIELGVGASLMQMNADGTCPRVVVKGEFAVISGPVWQPGPTREAGRINC